jgi:hypothetical protein
MQMTSEHSDEWQSRDYGPKLKLNRTDSKLVNDVRSEEEIRQKLNHMSPANRERHLSRIPTI